MTTEPTRSTTTSTVTGGTITGSTITGSTVGNAANTSPASGPGPDPRPVFADAVATARSVIASVTPEDLGASTPCSDFDVEDLLGHMVIVVRRVTALGEGSNPMAMPDAVTGVAADGWLAAFDAQAERAAAAWGDDAVLDRPMTLPWVEAPGRAMLPAYVPELTVHTWDLAHAIGADVEWNEPTLGVAFAAAERLLPPAPRREFVLPNGMAAPFDDPIEIGAEAPAIDRLVAFYGRHPA